MGLPSHIDMSPEEHSAAVQSGMAKGKIIRDEFLDIFAEGATSFTDAVELSKVHETRYLSTLKISDLLLQIPGWDEFLVLDVLTRNGFEPNDTLKSIRRSQRKVALLDHILKKGPQRRENRPAPPSGWPWNGKMEMIARAREDMVHVPEVIAGDPPVDDPVEDSTNLSKSDKPVSDMPSDPDPLASLLDDED